MSRRSSYGWVVLGAAFVIITMAIGTLFALAVFLTTLWLVETRPGDCPYGGLSKVTCPIIERRNTCERQ